VEISSRDTFWSNVRLEKGLIQRIINFHQISDKRP
jgi:hypothetical protein